jgi:hypothetical protein
MDAPLQVTQDQFKGDIHAQKGLTCASCHGGDPTSGDPEKAMGRAAGFRGHIAHADVPKLCGSCHSDANKMKQYNPSLRTDQFAQYQTSRHGKLLATGDQKTAVCTDCHGVHNIRPASDPRSPVHPLNIATTCAHCHANAEYMKPYKIPTDQYANYKASVHSQAMTVRGDLSAPTCTTCHGNHGATPPGVASVENVCSNCHVFQAQLFDKSPHKAAFAAAGFATCITCHSNHRIEHPTDQFLGTGPGSVCMNCHSQGDDGFRAAETISKDISSLDTSVVRSDAILARAEESGMEVSEANLQETQARDALMKARVTIHSFTPELLHQDVTTGLDVTKKTYAAGLAAMAERQYRRKGLAVSLLFILLVVGGLAMYIRAIESEPKNPGVK